MIPNGHVYLSGFMAVGKSTVGPLVADRMHRTFVDLDRRIEETAGHDIPTLFATEGEPGFRARERTALQTVATEPPAVVAVGGGAMVDERNRALARRTGVLLTLSAKRETLRARMDASHRPWAARWAELLETRAAVYADFDVQVTTDGRTPTEVAEVVLSLVSAS